MNLESFARLRRLGNARRRLLVRAAVILTAASAAVLLLPFRRAIRFGTAPVAPTPTIAAEDCVWAIRTARRFLPWRTVCIEQGLAGQRMLRDGGLDALLHYGVRHHPLTGKLEAHVWVTVGGKAVIGGAEAAQFAAVAIYPSRVR